MVFLTRYPLGLENNDQTGHIVASDSLRFLRILSETLITGSLRNLWKRKKKKRWGKKKMDRNEDFGNVKLHVSMNKKKIREEEKSRRKKREMHKSYYIFSFILFFYY
jgi:hypothetical protein